MARFTIEKIKEIAEFLWWEGKISTTTKFLAKKFNLTEDQVDQLRSTREYQQVVQDLMLRQRSAAEDFEKWVNNYNKQYDSMESAFGKRMGILPEVVSTLLENVRNAHADIAAGKTKAPKAVENPQINMNLNAEKTLGTGQNSVYLYYDQQERDSAESKGENVWACKIGMTVNELHTRIYQQVSTALPAERLRIGLRIKTDKHEKIERVIHDILKVRGKHIEEALGTEWFLTSPSEVEGIYNFIVGHSDETTTL